MIKRFIAWYKRNNTRAYPSPPPWNGGRYDDWHRPPYADTLAGDKNPGYKEYMESMDNFGR